MRLRTSRAAELRPQPVKRNQNKITNPKNQVTVNVKILKSI
jgi:hypothetical protein